uniref:RING-type domain-containing protein n=2 Tax=Setaria italica TaxID=4555 RepID=K3YMJ8_SETIT
MRPLMLRGAIAFASRRACSVWKVQQQLLLVLPVMEVKQSWHAAQDYRPNQRNAAADVASSVAIVNRPRPRRLCHQQQFSRHPAKHPPCTTRRSDASALRRAPGHTTARPGLPLPDKRHPVSPWQMDPRSPRMPAQLTHHQAPLPTPMPPPPFITPSSSPLPLREHERRRCCKAACNLPSRGSANPPTTQSQKAKARGRPEPAPQQKQTPRPGAGTQALRFASLRFPCSPLSSPRLAESADWPRDGMEAGRLMRRSVTLADQLAAVGPPQAVGAAAGSCNLRDLLKLRDEDDLAAGRRAAVTLASAMAAERQVSLPSASPSASTAAAAAAVAARTLLDIIRDDQPPPAAASGDGPGAADPFLVRRAVSLPAPTTAASTPAVAPASASPAPSPAPPPPLPPQPPAVAEAAEEEEQGERVSLMALLEQTDRQWSAGAGAAAPREEEDVAGAEALELVEDDTEPGAGAGRGVVAGCCCVCMARAKGAAFIPCGHTFCRACARELLAGRGRCPLCNAAIVDVLDIF